MKKQINRMFEDRERPVTLRSGLAGLSLTLGLILLYIISMPGWTSLNSPDFLLNAGITVFTFLSVFFIQQSGKVKPNVMQTASNPSLNRLRYLGLHIRHVNEMNERELDHLHAYYKRLSDTKD